MTGRLAGATSPLGSVFANRPVRGVRRSACGLPHLGRARAEGGRDAASGPGEPERDPEGRRRAENGEHTHGQSLGAR